MNRAQMMEQFTMAVKLFALTLDEEQAMIIATVYDPWREGVTYAQGLYLTHGKNAVGDPQLYKVNQTHTSSALYPPGSVGSEALYTAIGLTDAGYPLWSQPTGAHDAYNTGDIVDYGGMLYESQIDGNTTVPGTDERWWKVYTA